jgi:glycosyltransferase involved in cell wall biosynthesis
VGGAERQLVKLVRGLDKSQFDVTVATFYDGGSLRPEMEAVPGVRVISLQKKGRWDLLGFLIRLRRAVAEVRPHVIHGYMGVANEFALLVGRMAGSRGRAGSEARAPVRVVWGLENSRTDCSGYGLVSAWSYRIGAHLSRFPDLIIANSEAGRKAYSASGYSRRRMIVIPNGIDADLFCPDPEARRAQRAAWGMAPGETLIGLIARLDPVKDHRTFLRAAARVAPRHPELRFVCVGSGPDAYRDALHSSPEAKELGERLIWAGESTEMPAVYNALDIACNTSHSEGLSNVIGEAMATGVPCVVTDVGDSARVVGDPSLVVSPGDPAALAAAWSRVLDLPEARRKALACEMRERIVTHYSVQSLAANTEGALLSLL